MSRDMCEGSAARAHAANRRIFDAGTRSDEGEELVEGGGGVLAHEDAVHAEGAGGVDVAWEVVEEDGARGVVHADARERGVEDRGVGLAHTLLARVDDRVEELVERELPAPRVAVLADVV